MRALYEWRHYLQGSQLKFEIWMHHKNLEYFTTTKKLNRRQARWSLELSEYDFALIHKPGKQHAKTDVLSRRSGHEKGAQDNLNLVLLPEQYFRRMDGEEFLKAMPAVLDDTAGDQFMEDIKAGKADWEDLVKKALKEKAEGWEEHKDGFVTRHRTVYVPPTGDLRHRILRAHYDDYILGHPGQFRTAEQVTRNYYWPSLLSDAKRYISACPVCQRTKLFPSKLRGPLHPNVVLEQVWQNVSVDLITKLPVSKGYDSIAGIVDRRNPGDALY
jgi:hypothetical protein